MIYPAQKSLSLLLIYFNFCIRLIITSTFLTFHESKFSLLFLYYFSYLCYNYIYEHIKLNSPPEKGVPNEHFIYYSTFSNTYLCYFVTINFGVNKWLCSQKLTC